MQTVEHRSEESFREGVVRKFHQNRDILRVSTLMGGFLGVLGGLFMSAGTVDFDDDGRVVQAQVQLDDANARVTEGTRHYQSVTTSDCNTYFVQFDSIDDPRERAETAFKTHSLDYQSGRVAVCGSLDEAQESINRRVDLQESLAVQVAAQTEYGDAQKDLADGSDGEWRTVVTLAAYGALIGASVMFAIGSNLETENPQE